MDLKAKDWITGYDYQKDDIVKYLLDYDKHTDFDDIIDIEETAFFQKLFEEDFNVQSNYKYYTSLWAKKSEDKITSLSDAYIILNDDRATESPNGNTVLTNEDFSDLFTDKSSGLGFFVIYKDEYGDILDVDYENVFDLYDFYTAGQIDTNDWTKLFFNLSHTNAPEEAETFNIIFFSNISLDENQKIEIKLPEIKYLSPYFYATDDHTASEVNSPESDLEENYWTQQFKWRPDFKGRSKFNAFLETMAIGEGGMSKTLNHINGIEGKFNLSFSMLTEKTANAIIHFLQHKTEVDENFYNYSNLGLREDHQFLQFDYDLFFPFKKMKVYCEDFSHNIDFDNLHSIQATFISRKPITDSVYSFQGYHNKLDGKITINFNNNENGLYNFQVDEGNFDFIVGETYGNVTIDSIDVDIGSCPIINETDSNGDPVDIYLKNYQTLRLKENISSGDDDNISFEAMDDIDISMTENKMEIIIPNPCYKHSLFLKEVYEEIDYPYNKIKSFKFLPSYVLEVNHEPKSKKADIDRIYNPPYKYGINANNNFSLNFVFDNRSEKECASLLAFFERHLGYKSFKVQLPDPYAKQRNQRFFYCPSWDHQYIYKNNHRVTATFVECVNIEEE